MSDKQQCQHTETKYELGNTYCEDCSLWLHAGLPSGTSLSIPVASVPAKDASTITVPFTRQLTVLMHEQDNVELADRDLKTVEAGGTVIKSDVDENYFHALRLRVSENRELAKKVAVFYVTRNGEFKEINLLPGKDVTWPVGFANEAWDIESRILRATGTLKEDAVPPQAVPAKDAREWHMVSVCFCGAKVEHGNPFLHLPCPACGNIQWSSQKSVAAHVSSRAAQDWKADHLFAVYCDGNPDTLPNSPQPIHWDGWQRLAGHLNATPAAQPDTRKLAEKIGKGVFEYIKAFEKFPKTDHDESDMVELVERIIREGGK